MRIRAWSSDVCSADLILKGITRDSIVTLTRSWGMDVQEREVSVAELVDAMAAGKLQEAFAVGTAAPVTQMSEIGYQGKVYQLPAIGTRELAPRILQELHDQLSSDSCRERVYPYV